MECLIVEYNALGDGVNQGREGQDGIVGFDHIVRNLGRRQNCESLGDFTVVLVENLLYYQGSKARARSSTK